MKQNQARFYIDKLFIKTLFLLFFLQISSNLFGQSVTDFSGQWAFDISKSKAGEGSSFGSKDIIHTIEQNKSTITITEAYSNQDYSVSNAFDLNGKETLETKGSRTIKKTAKWSPDKKTLILTTITTIAGNNYRKEDSYKLENNGLTLVVNSVSDNNPKDLVIWVFNKVKEQK
jgi:myo-inositol-1-phosphate synthase